MAQEARLIDDHGSSLRGILQLFREEVFGDGFRLETVLAQHADRLARGAQVRDVPPGKLHALVVILRGLGWDIDSPYSSNRGELFPIGSYGHTGFTGTSVWIDPSTKAYLIVLTNVVHPHRGKSLTAFRSKLATAFAASIGVDAPGVSVVGYNETSNTARRTIAPNHQTLTGIDVMEQDNFVVPR